MKQSLEQLAVFGGQPTFEQPLYVGRPNIGNEDRLVARLKDILHNRWLTNHGPYVQELERKVAEIAGVKHCIAMCNATIALEIAIRAAGTDIALTPRAAEFSRGGSIWRIAITSPPSAFGSETSGSTAVAPDPAVPVGRSKTR